MLHLHVFTNPLCINLAWVGCTLICHSKSDCLENPGPDAEEASASRNSLLVPFDYLSSGMASFLEKKTAREARQTQHRLPTYAVSNAVDGAAIPRFASAEALTRQEAASVTEQPIDPEESVAADEENRTLELGTAGMHVRKRRKTGRGLFANVAYEPGSPSPRMSSCSGQVIYRTPSTPPVTVLSTSHLASHCSRCFLSPQEAALLRKRTVQGIKRCGACKAVHYCSAVSPVAPLSVPSSDSHTRRRDNLLRLTRFLQGLRLCSAR